MMVLSAPYGYNTVTSQWIFFRQRRASPRRRSNFVWDESGVCVYVCAVACVLSYQRARGHMPVFSVELLDRSRSLYSHVPPLTGPKSDPEGSLTRPIGTPRDGRLRLRGLQGPRPSDQCLPSIDNWQVSLRKNFSDYIVVVVLECFREILRRCVCTCIYSKKDIDNFLERSHYIHLEFYE